MPYNVKNRKNQIIINKTVKKMCGTVKNVNRTDNIAMVRVCNALYII